MGLYDEMVHGNGIEIDNIPNGKIFFMNFIYLHIYAHILIFVIFTEHLRTLVPEAGI